MWCVSRYSASFRRLLPTVMLLLFLLSSLELSTDVVKGKSIVTTNQNNKTDHFYYSQKYSSDEVKHLKMLAESDLRKMLFDKTNGKIDLSEYKTKLDLINVLYKMELEEEANREFERRVKEAMEKRRAMLLESIDYSSSENEITSKETFSEKEISERSKKLHAGNKIIDDTIEKEGKEHQENDDMQDIDLIKVTHRRHRRRGAKRDQMHKDGNHRTGVHVVNGFEDDEEIGASNDAVHTYDDNNSINSNVVNNNKYLKERYAGKLYSDKYDGKRRHNSLYSRKHHLVKVLYCTGWGYARYYEEVRHTLEKTLPNIDDITITGDTYPTPLLRAICAQICKTCFFACLGLALFGNYLTMFPEFVLNFVAQRRGTIVTAGFILNLVGNALAQTGAFEVWVDNVNVYSKLKTGSVPTAENLRKSILELTVLNEAEAKTRTFL